MTLLGRAPQAGATARLKGVSRFNNPFEADYEMPPKTGEPLDHWFAKFEAWRSGRETGSPWGAQKFIAHSGPRGPSRRLPIGSF